METLAVELRKEKRKACSFLVIVINCVFRNGLFKIDLFSPFDISPIICLLANMDNKALSERHEVGPYMM